MHGVRGAFSNCSTSGRSRTGGSSWGRGRHGRRGLLVPEVVGEELAEVEGREGIVFERVDGPMKVEAAEAGFHDPPSLMPPVPKVQLLTIEGCRDMAWFTDIVAELGST